MAEIGAALSEAFSLAGRTALVTGAGSGLAEAIAMTMARAGARVIAAHDDAGEAERVATSSLHPDSVPSSTPGSPTVN